MNELEKYPGSDDLYNIDCTGLLASNETLLTVSSVTALPALAGSNGLSFGTRGINAAPITFPDGSVGAIGKVITVKVAGGAPEPNQPKRNYAIILTCTSSLGNTIVAKADMQVLTLYPLNNLH